MYKNGHSFFKKNVNNLTKNYKNTVENVTSHIV